MSGVVGSTGLRGSPTATTPIAAQRAEVVQVGEGALDDPAVGA